MGLASRRSRRGFTTLLLGLVAMSCGRGEDPAQVAHALEHGFASGCLIIPLDGNHTAHGLVQALLVEGVPLKWAIRDGKPAGGEDFRATVKTKLGRAKNRRVELRIVGGDAP